jgi:hypothetical protein
VEGTGIVQLFYKMRTSTLLHWHLLYWYQQSERRSVSRILRLALGGNFIEQAGQIKALNRDRFSPRSRP